MEINAIGRMEALPEEEMTQTSPRQARCQLIIADEYTGGLIRSENDG